MLSSPATDAVVIAERLMAMQAEIILFVML
jgi:hypothetical protein